MVCSCGMNETRVMKRYIRENVMGKVEGEDPGEDGMIQWMIA